MTEQELEEFINGYIDLLMKNDKIQVEGGQENGPDRLEEKADK